MIKEKDVFIQVRVTESERESAHTLATMNDSTISKEYRAWINLRAKRAKIK
jgi:hypothetical protein